MNSDISNSWNISEWDFWSTNVLIQIHYKKEVSWILDCNYQQNLCLILTDICDQNPSSNCSSRSINRNNFKFWTTNKYESNNPTHFKFRDHRSWTSQPRHNYFLIAKFNFRRLNHATLLIQSNCLRHFCHHYWRQF